MGAYLHSHTAKPFYQLIKTIQKGNRMVKNMCSRKEEYMWKDGGREDEREIIVRFAGRPGSISGDVAEKVITITVVSTQRAPLSLIHI